MKDEKVFVLQMLERAERILSYTKTGREEFLKDPKTQDAVVRNFEIIGEAAKRVSPALRGRAGDIPWARIAGFRDVLIHRYQSVDLEQVWQRVEKDLPPLKESLEALLKRMDEPE